MPYRNIIRESLNNFSAQLAAKVLCSKIEKRWMTMVSDRDRTKAKFQICNNNLEGDWNTLVFDFKYGTTNTFQVFIEDENHHILVNYNFKFQASDEHAARYVNRAYVEVVNELYKLFAKSESIELKPLQSIVDHFKPAANYVNKL